jgi:hypothetical protein
MSAMRLKFVATQAILGICVSLSANAQDFTLTHNNSSAQVNITNAGAGVLNWKVDGVNNLSDQRFFYRVGSSGPESLVQSISSSPTVSFTQIPNVLSKLDVTYANASFSVRTVFQLTGGTGTSGTSGLSETITVKNLTGSILDFHLFQYSDFDLYGLTGGQTAQYSFDALAQPYKVTQTDGTRSVTEILNASTATIGHYDAALAGATLASLMDGSATVLGDNASSAGNVTFAYQWDASLSPNGTLTISKLMNIVPEPSSAALVLMGVSALFIRRRSDKNI